MSQCQVCGNTGDKYCGAASKCPRGTDQLAYEHAKSVGWNEAIEAAACLVEQTGLRNPQNIARDIRGLDRSMQAIDD